MLLVPCALLLFAVHGEVLVGIAGCGAILAYVADAAGLWLVGLVLTWCTVAAVVVALWILGLSSMGTSLFSVFLLNNFSFVTVQLGLWATLHVPQLRLDFAELLEQAEQLLFSTLCMPATALFCWAIASVAGTANVPFYAAFVMFFALKMSVMPAVSTLYDAAAAAKKTDVQVAPRALDGSISSAPAERDAGAPTFVCGSMVTVLHMYAFLLLPAALFVAIHHRIVFSFFGAANVLLLQSLAAMLLLSLSRSKGDRGLGGLLWWMDVAPERIDALQPKLLGAAIAVFALCFEYRVVIHGAPHLLAIAPASASSSSAAAAAAAAPASLLRLGVDLLPRTRVLVYGSLTAGTLALSLLLNLLLQGRSAAASEEAARQRQVRGSALVAVFCFCHSLAVPLVLWPVALLATVVALKAMLERMTWLHLLALVGAAALVGGVAVYRTLWFLDVILGDAGISLRDVCALGVAMLALAVFIGGLGFMTLQAQARELDLVAAMEQPQSASQNSPRMQRAVLGFLLVLYSMGLCVAELVLVSQSPFGSDAPMYGAYLPVATSLALWWTARRLQRQGRIGARSFWMISALSAAKLSVLFSHTLEALAVAVLASLAIAAPLTLYRSSLVHPQQPQSSATGAGSASRRGDSGMSVQRAALHAASIVVPLYLAKELLLRDLLALLGVDSPSPSLMFGAWLLVAAVATAPLSFVHLAHLPSARRGTTVVVALALLFMVIQPELDVWGAAAAARGGASPVALLSLEAPATALSDASRWPAWLLFLALALMLVAATVTLPMPRLLFSLVIGTCVGLYVCGVYLPPRVPVYALFVAMFVAASVIVVYLFWPTLSSPRVVATAYGLLVALLPVTFALEGELFGFSPRRRGQDQLLMSRVALASVQAFLHFVIALSVKLWRASYLRELKREELVRGEGYHRHGPHAADESPTQVHVGNAATLLAMALTVYLQVTFFKGSDLTVVMLAPVLLLLNRDNAALASLHHERRYFPLVLFVCGYLVASAATEALARPLLGALGLWSGVAWQPWRWARELFCLVLALPSQHQLLLFAWDSRQQQSDFAVMALGPLNLFPILLAATPALRILGVLGLCGAATQLYSAHAQRRQGLRVV